MTASWRISLTDIANEEAAEASRNGESLDPDDYYPRYDVSDSAFVKMHPGPTAIGGTAKVLRFFPGDPDDEDDDPYVGLVLEDPFLHDADEDTENTALFKSTQERGDDYKVVNLNDEDAAILEGVGLEYDDGRVFRSEQVEEFEEDEIILKLTGNAGRGTTACLDVHGKGGADVERNDEGEPIINPDTGWPDQNNAPLLEYPPDDVDAYRARYHRDTQIRPDLKGEEVVIMLQRRKNVQGQPDDAGGHWSTVFATNDDGDWETIKPTDEFEPDELLVRATAWLEWAFPEEAEVERLREEQGVEVNE